MSELNKAEKYLLENLIRLSEEGCVDENPRPKYKDGTPAHTVYITPVFESYDISKGETPITELREIKFEKAIGELLWIYQDQSNDINLLEEKYNIKWWRDWQVGDTDTIGIRYGATIKKYDLMNKLLDGLTNDKYGRRHIIDMFQYADFEESDGLIPCAYSTLWTVRTVNKVDYLDVTLVQRSNDYLVASHINKIQYLALQMMVAKHCGYEVGKFNHLVQNLHIYDRHVDQAEEMMKRVNELKQRETQSQPKLILNVPNRTNLYDIKASDFELVDYNPIQPQLKFELGI